MKVSKNGLLMLTKFNRYIAFTLAEVLITLGIIGVVAAMVIPTLIANYQKTQYVAGYQKAYSELQQMIKSYMADENVESLEQTELFTTDGENYIVDSPTRQAIVDNVIKKYFKVIKTCKTGDTSCEIQEGYLGNPQDTINGFYNDDYIFCTVDGFCFDFWLNTQSQCVPDNSSVGPMKAYCGAFGVDVNGNKPPNIFGRDYHSTLMIAPNGVIYPYGGAGAAQFCYGSIWATSPVYWKSGSDLCGAPNSSLSSTVTGQGCAGRIQEEGWEMNY